MRPAAAQQNERSFRDLQSQALTCDTVQHALNLCLHCPDLCVCNHSSLMRKMLIMLAQGMRELIRIHSCVASCQLERQTKVLIMGGCSLSEFAIKVGIFTVWSLQITLWKSLMWPRSSGMNDVTSNMLKHEDEYSAREKLSTLRPLYLSAGEAHLCGVIC